MYMRSLFLKQLKGNQLGTTGLLLTCVSHHMTDMQFSNKLEDEVLKTNGLGIADGIGLIERQSQVSVAYALLDMCFFFEKQA